MSHVDNIYLFKRYLIDYNKSKNYSNFNLLNMVISNLDLDTISMALQAIKSCFRTLFTNFIFCLTKISCSCGNEIYFIECKIKIKFFFIACVVCYCVVCILGRSFDDHITYRHICHLVQKQQSVKYLNPAFDFLFIRVEI